MLSSSLAVQMYTVREASSRDFKGALRRVAEMGYNAVELAGLYNLTPTELHQTLNDLGLKCLSAHVGLPNLRVNLDQEIETYLTLGASYLICPWLPPAERGDAASYRALAAELNSIGERCRVKGLLFCYHNHDFELAQFGGQYALDILLENSDPANVQLEADLYWLKFAGVDPAAYIRRWPGRMPLLHFKDMSATRPPTFAAVGAGILDWPAIIAAANDMGVQWPVIEQDTCPGDPFESLKISVTNYHRLVG
jgi:sugar phosphate isomerase/epimerase